ncbi:hypothetical protein ACP70R_036469 [Stipagrostis hirtigluma subsp. patula]
MSPPPCPESAMATTIPCSSKRRRIEPDGADSWASLHEDLVQLIGCWVLAGDLLDYVRFRAVCTHWKSSTVGPRGRGLVDPRFHPRRWMMLPEGYGLYPGHPSLGGYVRFFNLSTGVFVRVHLPLFQDHTVLDSTDGLLLLHRDNDTAIRLLHPFTGDIAEFPPLLSVLPQMEPRQRYGYMTEDSKFREIRLFLRGVSAAVSVSAAGTITIMLGLDIRHRVAHATAGDQQWSLSAWKLPRLQALTMSSQGKLYATAANSADKNNVYVCQIDPPQPNADGSLSLLPPRMIVRCPVVGTICTAHLVECGSELMLVGFSDRLSAQVEAWDLRQSHTRVEQFDLGSGTWSPALDAHIPHRDDRIPASPYTLAHHIFTCCYRNYWNRGLMLCTAIKPEYLVKPIFEERGSMDGHSWCIGDFCRRVPA